MLAKIITEWVRLAKSDKQAVPVSRNTLLSFISYIVAFGCHNLT